MKIYQVAYTRSRADRDFRCTGLFAAPDENEVRLRLRMNPADYDGDAVYWNHGVLIYNRDRRIFSLDSELYYLSGLIAELWERAVLLHNHPDSHGGIAPECVRRAADAVLSAILANPEAADELGTERCRKINNLLSGGIES